MNHHSQKGSSSDEVCDQDQSLTQENLEKSFLDICEQQKKSQQNNALYSLETPKPIQMMFILFSFYQETLTLIGIENNCKVKISLNKIKISSDTQQKDVDKCHASVNSYLQKISYVQFKHENSFKILLSPFFNKKAEEKGFKLCRFNQKIYCHSDRMNQKNLENKMKELFSGQFIFTVDIKSRKSKERQVYNHLRNFIKIMMKHDSEEFKNREVVVELDYGQVKINCIGSKQRDLVAVKNTLKNLLESTVIIVGKIQNQEEVDMKLKELKDYAKKISKYPIYISKLEKRTIAIISKENIIRKLFQKPLFCEIMQLNGKTELGMFIPRRYNYIQRKMMIEELCTKKGYDFTTLGGIYHYFKKMFIHQHQDEQIHQKQLLQLVNEIMCAIKENKQRFSIPEKFVDVKIEKKDIEVTVGQYYTTGEIVFDQALSKLLRSDVTVQKLKMSKPAFIKYKLCESPESEKIYWYIKDQDKMLCKPEDMKLKTEYFSGRVKKSENQDIYFFESKIRVQ